MGFVGNQIINMMINQIKRNNPSVGIYLDEIQNGGNPLEILSKAINNKVITKQQFNQVKPLLKKYGNQIGINISQKDLDLLENKFNCNCKQNKSGFRF